MTDRFTFRDVVVALLENAVDEARAGHCRVIDVELSADAVRVSDDGRGLPLGPHPQSGRPLSEVILTGPRRGPRNTLARVNAACLWLELRVCRDGALWAQRFEFARPEKPLERRGAATGSGTTITAAPAQGEAPSFEELRECVRALSSSGLGRAVRVRLRDRRASRDETIVIGRR
ncbi:MAG: hypothetical protein D6731_22085 [Planctomycetota bacterium]|nr:MAG: hypothetical protein D6731_22085 [Planctomycetota bacterium]